VKYYSCSAYISRTEWTNVAAPYQSWQIIVSEDQWDIAPYYLVVKMQSSYA